MNDLSIFGDILVVVIAILVATWINRKLYGDQGT